MSATLRIFNITRVLQKLNICPCGAEPETSELSESLVSEVEGRGVRSTHVVAMSKHKVRSPYLELKT